MSIRIRAAHWIVANVAVQIQRLRIAENGVGDRRRPRSPVRRHEPPQAGRIVARTKVVETALCVPLLAAELVAVRLAGDDRNLPAIGIVVRFLRDRPAGIRDYVRRTQMVGAVIFATTWRLVGL